MLVQERIYNQFVIGFIRHSQTLKVGDGLEAGTTMGPMANPRRITAMETFIGDAAQRGATVQTGGHRIGNKGNFFEPTVLTDVPKDARVMNEEPFGPLAVISPFSSFDEVWPRPTDCPTASLPMRTHGPPRRRMRSLRRWRAA
jgi:succinate-semialdehyde dehydrogenase/glutarate-semialdehyde dehydrogenase